MQRRGEYHGFFQESSSGICEPNTFAPASPGRVEACGDFCSSLALSTVNCELSTVLRLLCFQQLPTVKFSKRCLLITIRIAGGWYRYRGATSSSFKYYFKSLLTLVARIGRSPVREFFRLFRKANRERQNGKPPQFSRFTGLRFPLSDHAVAGSHGSRNTAHGSRRYLSSEGSG